MTTRRQALAAVAGPALSAWLPRLARAEGGGLPRPAREVAVADAGALAAALRDARPGDHLVLGDGDYDGEAVVASGGTQREPVVVRAARPLGARITGRLRVRADDVLIQGLEFTAGVGVAGDRSRVTRCRFIDTENIALAVTGGLGVTVDRCAFVGCRGRGVSVAPDGKDGVVSEPRIHRNHFADFAGREGDNSHEAVQIGQFGDDALLRVGALVEDNLFVGINIDTETISIKSSGNTIRRNTFLDCRSRPTNRFGNDNVWHANWVENCRGVWIYGAGHELAGNRIVGSRDGLCLMAGNTSPDAIRPAKRDGGRRRDLRPYCRDVTLVANEADRLVVGKVIKQFGEPYTLPAVGTRVVAQQGPIELELERDTRIEEEAAASATAAPVAVKLAAAAVGPGAP